MGTFGGSPFGTTPFAGDSDVSSLDFIFSDPTPYTDIARRRAQIASQKASYFTIDARYLFTVTVPVLDFVYEDATRYRQQRFAAGALSRQSYIADASWWQDFIVQPAMDWLFYDGHPYRQIQTQRLAQDRARRSEIDDASGYQNFVFTVPNFSYHFMDSHPYQQLAQRRAALDRASRNAVIDGWIPFAAGFPALPTDFFFYDSHPYRNLAERRRQQVFNRNDFTQAPPQANIVAPFVSPAAWLPVANAIARPTYQRRSFWTIGLPDDIGGNAVTIISWLPVTGYPDQRWLTLRTRESMFADPAPKPVILPPPSLDPGFSTADIVGALFNVCTDVRTMLAVKLNAATVCEQLRSYAVPANTQQLCQTFLKDPQSVIDFSVDWTAPLATSGDTILTSSWTASAGIIITSSTYVTDTATVFLSGGTDQTSYTVTNTITTAGGRTLAQDLVIKVVLQ